MAKLISPEGTPPIDEDLVAPGLAAIERAVELIRAHELPAEVVAANELLEAYADDHQVKYVDIDALLVAARVLKRRAGLPTND